MIPREILDKNGPLSEEERAVMEQHSRLGFEEIKTQNIRVAYLLVSHHEYQARPYPRDGNKEIGSLSKNETLIRHMGRILAILDHYDSLRSKRAYKEEMPKPKAIEIIKHEFYEEGDQKVITFLEQLDD